MHRNSLIIFIKLCFFVLIFINLLITNNNKKEAIYGVKLFEYSGNYTELFSEFNELGINSVFIVSPNTINDSLFHIEAKKHNINVFITAQIFMNETALTENPELYAITENGEKAIESWAHFVCPTNEKYRTERIDYFTKLVEKVNPYSLSIDFIRYFNFWEHILPNSEITDMKNSCFCEDCLEKFQKDTKIQIPSKLKNTDEKANWILKNHEMFFTKWKCNIITTMVRDLAIAVKKVKPNIVLNLHAVPWKQTDYDGAIKKIVAQDFKELSKYVDFISPMCYSNLLQRDAKWINEIVKDINNYSTAKVLPSIQINKIQEQEKDYSIAEFKNALDESLKSPSEGVVLFVWDWDSIKKDKDRKSILKQKIIDIKKAS